MQGTVIMVNNSKRKQQKICERKRKEKLGGKAAATSGKD